MTTGLQTDTKIPVEFIVNIKYFQCHYQNLNTLVQCKLTQYITLTSKVILKLPSL